jgi:hypothetical protein
MCSSKAAPQVNGEDTPYFQHGNIYAMPITHYNMEMAGAVFQAFQELKPDCVAVELAETMALQLMHGASRLPDISLVVSYNNEQQPIYYLVEPCDAAFEALRSALEVGVPAFCIDLDVDAYPDTHELLPDPYAVSRIGLRKYFEVYRQSRLRQFSEKSTQDKNRELYMAKRLKELSFSYDKILFVGGMAHLDSVLALLDNSSFPALEHAERDVVQLCTLTEHSARDVMVECGWISSKYEELRNSILAGLTRDPHSSSQVQFPPDRQKMIYSLYKEASLKYIQSSGHAFPGYHMRNLMKFMRNYALVTGRLMPDLFQMLSAAKGCVDHNYAYEVWALATEYSYRKNVDNLMELDLSIQDVWGNSKLIRFHLKQPGRKAGLSFQKRADKSKYTFQPPGIFGICSYPPEDLIVENFGKFLQKKGIQLLSEEASRVAPFVTSIEDGIDTRETIRHWHEKKLYVKVRGKPPGGVGSVVMIFNAEENEENEHKEEKYPWKATWLGEHSQESDMAFYATPLAGNIVGPGISRCEYGGFMMSYPPRRLRDVWTDPDYVECRSKAEVLLVAAIDYSVKPIVVYVAAKPPRSALKSFARRYGKKIVFIPIGQLSPITLNKIRVFHVLDGFTKRDIAGEYIY